eukprot:5811688-Pyramimonas_sp.AAC.1
MTRQRAAGSARRRVGGQASSGPRIPPDPHVQTRQAWRTGHTCTWQMWRLPTWHAGIGHTVLVVHRGPLVVKEAERGLGPHDFVVLRQHRSLRRPPP